MAENKNAPIKVENHVELKRVMNDRSIKDDQEVLVTLNAIGMYAVRRADDLLKKEEK